MAFLDPLNEANVGLRRRPVTCREVVCDRGNGWRGAGQTLIRRAFEKRLKQRLSTRNGKYR